MRKNTKDTFLLSKYSDMVLSLESLNQLIKEYTQYLKDKNLNIPKRNTLDLMFWMKREKISFGPYQDLTFFEISNRIYSDLVILVASKKLFEEHNIKSIELKLSNKGGNDLKVSDENGKIIIGEAFNSADSFFQIKLNHELKKFSKRKRGIIAFNESALNDSNKTYFEKIKLKYDKITFLPCNLESIIKVANG